MTTYFRTNTGFNLGLASSSESVYSSYSEDWKTNYHGFSTKMNLSMISFWDKSDASTIIIITFREIVTVLLNNLPPLPLLLHLILFHLQGLVNPARSRIQVLWRHQYLVHERARSNCMVWCLRPDNPTSALLHTQLKLKWDSSKSQWYKSR